MPRKSANTAGGVTQKPRSNVYTMMLILSLIALIIGCVVLWMSLNIYGTWPQWRTTGLLQDADSLKAFLPTARTLA